MGLIHKNNYVFNNRFEAGTVIASELLHKTPRNTVIIAVPKGGIPLSLSIASKLKINTFVCPVTRIYPPTFTEQSLGAMTLDGMVLINFRMLRFFGITYDGLSVALESAKDRLQTISNQLKPWLVPELGRDTNVLIIDDGTATGFTALATFLFMKTRSVNSITFVSPVLSSYAFDFLNKYGISILAYSVSKELPFKTRNFYCSFENVNLETCQHDLRLYSKGVTNI